MPWFESTLATTMIICSIVGAGAIGVFAGITLALHHKREMDKLNAEHIVQLERSVELSDQRAEIYKQEAELYKSILGVKTEAAGQTIQ